MNDEVLDSVGEKMGMDRKEVAHWQHTHKAEYEAEASKHLAERLKPFMDTLRTSHPMSEDKIRATANEHFKNTPNTIDRSDIDSTKRIADRNDVGERSRQRMEGDVSTLRGNTHQSFKEQDGKISVGKSTIDQEHQGLEKSFNTRKEKGIFMSVVDKTPLVGNIGNEISKSEDFGTPTSSYHNLKNPSAGNPSSITVEKLSPKETASNPQGDIHPSTYVRSMEDSIEQGKAANKMSSQGRQIKQLKDSIEMSKATIQEEAPLDMTSSPKVER